MKHIAYFLHDIHYNKKSGRLVFKQDEIEKYFFFHEGDVIQVKTNQPGERLGGILYKLEKIPRDTYEHMDDFIEPKMNLGEVLQKLGLISAQDLSDALAYQLRETILNTFSYFNADIYFQEKTGFAGKAEDLQINVPFLIEYGIRRMPYNTALKVFMARKTPRLKNKPTAVFLTDEEKDILNKFSGALTADTIFKGLKLSMELFWKSLYLFVCLDLVELGQEAVASREEAPRSAPDAEPQEMEETSQIGDVIAMREKISSSSYYQILNVARTASEEDIKKAYFSLARKFHPDRFDREAIASYRNQIDEVFDAITNAYKTLSSPDKRRIYDAGTVASTGTEDAQDLMKKAEIKFRQGKTLFNQERFDAAVSLLEEAVRLRKDKGDYYLLLAMAEAKIPTYRKKAEEDFLKAISLEAWNPEGYVGLGFLYKSEGLITKATKQFQRAVELDRDHKLALQELNQLTSGGKKKGLKDFMSMDIFGSKGSKKK